MAASSTWRFVSCGHDPDILAPAERLKKCSPKRTHLGAGNQHPDSHSNDRSVLPSRREVCLLVAASFSLLAVACEPSPLLDEQPATQRDGSGSYRMGWSVASLGDSGAPQHAVLPVVLHFCCFRLITTDSGKGNLRSFSFI